MDSRITLTVAIFEYLFCLTGIAAQTLLCATIIKYRKTTFSNPFYMLVVALAIPDAIHLSSEICCALPAVFRGLEDTPKWFLNSCGYFANASFFGLASLMLMIAINRYVAVCHFDTYKQHFGQKRIKGMIIACFGFSFIIPSIMYGCECYYDFTGFAWLFVCKPGGCAKFALDLNAITANSICGGVVLVYALISIKYRRIRNRIGVTLNQSDDDKRRRAKETKLMFQFGLICVVLIANQTFFWIFLNVATNEPSQMVLNFLRNLNSSISAFLYLTFASEVRSRLPWRKKSVVTRSRAIVVISRAVNMSPLKYQPDS